MLESLYFSIGGFFDGNKDIKIWNEDGIFYATYRGDFRERGKEYTKKLSAQEVSKLENSLKRCGISSWDDEYDNPEIMDGTQWEIAYKESGKDIKEVYGSNEYPKNWRSFTNAINAIFPKNKLERYIDE